MSLHGKGVITGIGETAYSKTSPKSAFELQIEASLAAISDAGLDPKQIDGIIPIGITGAPAEAFVTNLVARTTKLPPSARWLRLAVTVLPPQSAP